MKRAKQHLTLVTPTCTCCAQPTTLLPRDDLGAGLAVCQRSGQLYRPDGQRYVPTDLPHLERGDHRVSSIQIDLSRSGYA